MPAMTSVLIVGSGPTGLTLAVDLARRGVDVRIIDKAPQFPRSPRAKGPNARSLEVLHDLGVADRVLAAGATGIAMRKYWNGRLTGDSDPYAGRTPTPDAPYDRVVLISQWDLEEILRERLAEHGARVELDSELTALDQSDTGVAATLADGRRVEADYLVGCDGGHSTVRKLVGASFEGTTNEDQLQVIGTVEAEGLDRAVWHQWFDEHGGVMLCPIPHTERSWWFQAGPERDDHGNQLAPSLEGFRRLFERHTGLPGGTLTRAEMLSTYRVNVRMVDRYRFGRVFLAGDAAHVHPIAGGLGMNTGIQDAFNLGWKLGMVTTGMARPELLDTYGEERLPVGARTLDITTERLEAALESIRRPGGGLEAVVTTDTSNLNVAYGWSSLTRGEAGGRAPDAPCRNASGDTVRLFDVFAGPHFTVLGFGAASGLDKITDEWGDLVRTCAIDAGPASLSDVDDHARRAYGITDDTLVLVRPDNHIALEGTPDDVTAYLAALTRS
jgi:2-polyprenyl-6-methoxyphenol hydroxylase-like FAD-dependent oxidoreductase